MGEAGADVVLFSYEERDDATGNHMAYQFFDATDVARDPCSYAIRVQINPFCGLYGRAAFLRAGGYDEDPLVHYNENVAMHIRLAFAGLAFAVKADLALRLPPAMRLHTDVG
jgi:GT2 family glycosyltransferase